MGVIHLTSPHFQAIVLPRKQTLERKERKVWPVAVCAETASLDLLPQQNLGLLSQQPQSSSGLVGWGAGLTDNSGEVRGRDSAKPALEEHKANGTES